MESAQDAVIEDSTTTNTALQLTEVNNGDPTNTEPHLTRVATASYRRPSLDFLQDTRDARKIYLTQCMPLHLHALKGNWQEAKHILDANLDLKTAAKANGWTTVLHVAAGTNHYRFVEELLKILGNDKIEWQDEKGNTAFCFVAAAGNSRIAELMLKRNSGLPKIPGGDGMTPLHFAALQGRCPMACRLYPLSQCIFSVQDWNLLFFASIKTCNYHLALKVVRDRKQLAYTRDGDVDNGPTALHLLAQSQRPLDSCCRCTEDKIFPVKINPGMKQHVFLKLVNFLWYTILANIDTESKMFDLIRKPTPLLFDAAKVGNFECLSELISAYPSLIWEVDSKNRSIVHEAVLHRHASIYNLIHEIGSTKDIILTYEDEDENTILHLAAKLAPPGQLELVSGAAFQMWHEILWFEEVNKEILPSLRCKKNSKGLTARELFTKEHEELQKNAESWMKRTAESCMLISTVIATGVFSAVISIPGGMNDETKEPNYLDKTSFLIFAVSDATALISSATAILIFLSIIISRYAENDFRKSLPLKLLFGLITLFISITSMMVAFGSSFFITHNYGLKWVPSFISALACLPILVFMLLQVPLWLQIIYSAHYYGRALFKPGKNMLYVVDRKGDNIYMIDEGSYSA